MAKKKRSRTTKKGGAPQDGPAAQIVSLSAYARHRGVSRQAVMKAIATGRIEGCVSRDTARGYWEIDWRRADAAWEARTRDDHRSNAGEKLPPRAKNPQGDLFGGSSDGRPPVTVTDEDGRVLTVANLQAERMRWQAKLAALEYRRKAGDLIESSTAQKRAFSAFRELRDELFTLPSISGRLASLTDAGVIEDLLRTKIEEALAKLAERFRKELEE